MKVLLTDIAWPSVEPERQVLAKIGAELIVAETEEEKEFISLAPEVDGILTCWASVTSDVIKAAHKCKIIGRFGIGVDNIDVDAATALGIIVTNVPAYCLDEVSDHAMALLLACARKVPLLDKNVKNGNWDRQVGPPMHRLRGQNLGIIGFGKIGRTIALKAQAFGLNIFAFDPFVDKEIAKEFQVTLVDLPHLLRQSDFITIHAPLIDETRNLFGEEEFRMMKTSAYIINTARGGIIDIQALYKALKEGWIAGAALDVLPQEPPQPDFPLANLDNVILTPHAAFLSEESMLELEITGAEEVARVLSGQMPKSIVNTEVLESANLRATALVKI